jgi:hypothetical protein
MDSYGDTWNGGLVDVFVNGVEVISDASDTSYTYPYAGLTWYSFFANAGDDIAADYTAGSFASENYYAITDDMIPTTIFFETGGSGFIPDYTIPVDLGTFTAPSLVGWTQTGLGGWTSGTTAHSAPTSAYHTYFPLATYDDWLISPVIPISGVTTTDISWWSYKGLSSWYDFHGVYINIDGYGWTLLKEDVHTTDYTWVQSVETVDLTGATTVQIAFRFMGLNADTWYVDDVLLGTAFIPGHYEPGPLVYTEVFNEYYCIDTIDPCEQQTFCFDGVFTPENGPNCANDTYLITIETELCDPMDGDHSNDAYSELLIVDFAHDVAVDITSPSSKVPTDWLYYDDGINANAVAATAGGEWESAIRLTPTELAGFDGYSITEVQFYYGYNALSNPGNSFDVIIFDEGTATTPGPLLYTQPFVEGPSTTGHIVNIVLASDVTLDTSKDIWVGIQVHDQLTSGNYPFGCDAGPVVAGKGQWADLGSGWTQLTYGNWQIRAGIEVSSGPPGVDMWIGCGEQEICADIINKGTYDEVDDPSTICDYEGIIVYYNITQWIWTDPCEDPEYNEVFEEMQEMELLCGETKELCFTYDFTVAGVYEVNVWAELLDTDCNPDDNLDTLVLGVDCCDPISEHTLNPLMPNGCNNWYKQDVTVTITAYDPLCPDPCYGTSSGLKEIHYKLNGAETVKTGGSVTFKISQQGVNLVEYWAVDNAGNEETHFTFEIAIDSVKPTVDLIFEKIEDGTLQVKFTAIASDATSGITKVEFYRDTTLLTTITAAPFTYTITWEDAFKTSTFKAVATDGACNTGEGTVFGGDIPGAKAFVNSVAQSLAQIHVHALTQNI